jgi:predicted transcriptional regulator
MKERILELKEQGLTLSQIAKQLNISPQLVYYYLNRDKVLEKVREYSKNNIKQKIAYWKSKYHQDQQFRVKHILRVSIYKLTKSIEKFENSVLKMNLINFRNEYINTDFPEDKSLFNLKLNELKTKYNIKLTNSQKSLWKQYIKKLEKLRRKIMVLKLLNSQTLV